MKFEELSALYRQPLFDLISQSRAVHNNEIRMTKQAYSPSSFFREPEVLNNFKIDIGRAFCDGKVSVPGAQQKTLTERNYELEEILHRIHRSLHFPLRFWLPLVRDVNARRA